MSALTDYANKACEGLLAKQEQDMHDALRAVEDREWTLDEVKRRCSMVRHHNDPYGHETFCVDGRPMIQFYPMHSHTEVKQDSYVLHAYRPFRKLY